MKRRRSRNTPWVRVCVLSAPVALSAACVDRAAPSGTAPGQAPESSSAAPTTVADAGADALHEVEALDAAMRAARERIENAGQQATATARAELTRLEQRYAVVRQELRDAESRADRRAAAVRDETKTAARNLKHDLDRFVEGLTK